jgi:hypothetical protein
MADASKLPTSEVIAIRDLTAATYMAANVRIVMRELGVEEDEDAIREFVLRMVVPMNHAFDATWRALMKDVDGSEEAIQNLRAALHAL